MHLAHKEAAQGLHYSGYPHVYLGTENILLERTGAGIFRDLGVKYLLGLGLFLNSSDRQEKVALAWALCPFCASQNMPLAKLKAHSTKAKGLGEVIALA